MGIYSPLNYEQLNLVEGLVRPSTFKRRNNRSFAFWERALYERLLSVIEIENIPSLWVGEAESLLYYTLYRRGFATVFDSKEYGTTFQPCTLSGIGWFYQPIECIVTNPMLQDGSLQLKIGKDCELIKLTSDYIGVWDIIEYYAEKLSGMSVDVDVSIDNCKTPNVLAGKNKSAVMALKKISDKINEGNSSVYTDSRIMDDDNTKDGNPFRLLDFSVTKDTYLLSNQLEDMRSLLYAFDLEIGIATLPYDKKERLVSSEADATKEESSARCSVWVRNLNNSFEKVNKMFGLNLHAKMRNEGVASVVNSKDNNTWS